MREKLEFKDNDRNICVKLSDWRDETTKPVTD